MTVWNSTKLIYHKLYNSSLPFLENWVFKQLPPFTVKNSFNSVIFFTSLPLQLQH